MTSPETFDRAEFQAALRSWELRFRAITESAPDAIISADSRGLIDSWNKGAERMFGYSAEEIVGRPVRILMPERYRALHQKGLERVNAGGESRVIGSIVELSGLRKDGTEFPLELSLATWITGGERYFGGILRDITERKRTEEGLRRKTAFLELLQSVAQAANEARSPDQAILHCLAQVCALTGWPVGHAYLEDEGHVCGTTLWHLEDPERFHAFRSATEKTRFPAGVGLPGTVLATGDPVWVVDISSDPNFMRRSVAEANGLRSAFAFPVVIGSRVVAVLEFFSPDTAQPDEEVLEVMANIGRQLGRAIERENAAQTQRGATQRLEEADSLKTMFLQAVSHDLRTPLAAVLAFGQTLERGGDRLSREQAEDVTHRIVTNAKRLDRMLTGLLDLDRLAQGQVRLERRETDLGDVVRRLVEEFRFQSDRVIEADVGHVMANVDGEKVERIVDNLLANAIRHTPAGAGVWVRVTRDEDATTLVVEDSGPGVPPESREEIFQLYTRGPATSDRVIGTGVGLSLVARFAELHGGRAWVEDRPGGGASFRVYLPDAHPEGSGPGQPS